MRAVGYIRVFEDGVHSSEPGVRIRPLLADDLDSADRVLRLAFGTFLGLPDPAAAFGDRDYVRTRFRAAPDCAWAAEVDGDVVGSVFAARWGSFGFFGPLTVHPEHWDRGIASRLLQPVLESFERWGVRQAGLFTFASSPKHLGLYQRHGFWPGRLTVVAAKPTAATADGPLRARLGGDRERPATLLDEIRELTDAVFRGLDLEREIVAVATQRIGDTLVLPGDDELDGVAVCHCGAGSEAGSDTCYVKVAAVRPGAGAATGSSDSSTPARGSPQTPGWSGSSRESTPVASMHIDACSPAAFASSRSESRCTSGPASRPSTHRSDYVIDDLR